MSELGENRSLVADYTSEVRGLLDGLNDTLLEFKGSTEDLSLINALFRGCHSIKGVSAMFGRFPVSELVHKMEYLLDEVRRGSREVDASIIDVLSDGFDLVRRIIDEIADGGERALDTRDLQDRIDGLRFGARDDAAPPTGEVSAGDILGLPEHLHPHVDGYVLARVCESIRQEQSTYLMRIRFPVGDEVDLRELFEWVSMVGEPLMNIPSFDEIGDLDDFNTESSFLSYQYLLVSSEDERTIFQVIRSLSGIRDIHLEALHLLLKPTERQLLAGDESGLSPVPVAVRVQQERLTQLARDVGQQAIITSAVERLMRRATVPRAGDDGLSPDELSDVIRNAKCVTAKLQETITQMRRVPLGTVFGRFKQLVRDLIGTTGKNLRLEIAGDAVQADKAVVDGLYVPLMYLIRNAVDYGVETMKERRAAGKPLQATISLVAFLREGRLIVRVEDDGRGPDREKLVDKAVQSGLIDDDDGAAGMTDEEIYALMLRPGFSPVETDDELYGRGAGMDVVESFARSHDGTVRITSDSGRGSRIEISLPAAADRAVYSFERAWIVQTGSGKAAIPDKLVFDTIELDPGAMPESVSGWKVCVQGRKIPVLVLTGEVELSGDGAWLVAVERDGVAAGLVVDRIVDSREILICGETAPDEWADFATCETILATGEVIPVIDWDKVLLQMETEVVNIPAQVREDLTVA